MKNGYLITGKREVNHRIPKSIQSIFSHAPLFHHNFFLSCILTHVLLTWSIGWDLNNVRKWQMGFHSASKGLIILPRRESLNNLFQSRVYTFCKYTVCDFAECYGVHSLLYNRYRVFLGVKSGRGVTLTPHLLLASCWGKSRDIPLLPLWAVRPVQSLSACTRVYLRHLPAPTIFVFLCTLW